MYVLFSLLCIPHSIAKKNAEGLCKALDQEGTAVETFDFQITIIDDDTDNEVKLDVRLRILSSGEDLLLIKKNEKRILLSDIICLHR